jgi:serine/threonine-protein kinase RsbT
MTASAGDYPTEIPLRNDYDVLMARRAVRDRATRLGLDLVTSTKLVTAASELARNTVIHGRGGVMTMSTVHDDTLGPRTGLRLVFEDHGPGIPDLDRAMTGGWSSGTGLGLGLPGSQRLVHEFDLTSVVGGGTRVTVVVWHRGA